MVVNGKIGDLKLVYSGAYLVRNVDQQQDYTNYARGVFAFYYQCAGYSTNPATGQVLLAEHDVEGDTRPTRTRATSCA